MSTVHIANTRNIDRRIRLLALAFFSCCGTVLGVVASCSSESALFSLMRTAASSHVSIVGLILATLFPFLITIVAFCLSKPFLFLPFSFFKAFSYTLAAYSVRAEFLQAGWLVCMLLLFSDTVAVVALYWCWIGNIHGFRDSAMKDMLLCSVIALIAAFVDYLWVSPFLVALLND